MPVPKWQYHEPDRPGADFDALAEIYDRNMQKYRNIHGEIREVLDFLDLQPDQRILEIGAGTGEFSLAAASQCAKVYAVDLSSGMLKFAQKKAESRCISNVEFIQAGFLTYRSPVPLDAVVTQIALHHLPDFWKQIALNRMADMLKDGGKFCLRDIVYSFDVRDYENAIENHLTKASEIANDEFAGRISAHIKKEYSTMNWIMEGMIERAGISIIRKEYSDAFIGAYYCLKTNDNELSRK
jgi:ubiquinone/menaquinone biosynthesis C-methylase UbiE